MRTFISLSALLQGPFGQPIYVIAVLALNLFLTGCAARCQIDAEDFREVSARRGLKFKQEIPCRVLRQSQVQGYLRKSIEDRTDPKRLYAEGQSFKLLGFLPRDYPYPEGIISQYAGDLLALYSPEDRDIVFVQRKEKKVEREIVLHELVHALQDQYYDVRALIDPKLTNDVLLAHSALLEGDANWAARERGLRKSGEKYCQHGETGELLKALSSIADGRDGTPRSLRFMMEFPYLFGERLLCLLQEHGGKEMIALSYEQIPETTSDILFPEQYISRLKSDRSSLDESYAESRELLENSIDSIAAKSTASQCVGEAPNVDTLGPLMGFVYLTNSPRDESSFAAILKVLADWRSDTQVYLPESDEICWEIELGQEQTADQLKKFALSQIPTDGTSRTIERFGSRVVIRISSDPSP